VNKKIETVYLLREDSGQIGNPYLLGVYANERAAQTDRNNMGGASGRYSVQAIALDYEPVVIEPWTKKN